VTPTLRALPLLAACLTLAACSSTTNPGPTYGPPTITAASSFAAVEATPGAAMLVSGTRWRLMDDVLRECNISFTPPEAGQSAYDARIGACSHEMVHVSGWRTAGDTLDLFNARGEVIGRLTAEAPNRFRGKVTVVSGQQVDATLTKL
jgi:hypothetical protein